MIYDTTLLYRICVGDSPRAERGAAGGDAELGLDAAPPEPRHPRHAHGAHHAAPATTSAPRHPPGRRALRLHPNTSHYPTIRQRSRQIPIKIYDSSHRTHIFKMTY